MLRIFVLCLWWYFEMHAENTQKTRGGSTFEHFSKTLKFQCFAAWYLKFLRTLVATWIEMGHSKILVLLPKSWFFIENLSVSLVPVAFALADGCQPPLPRSGCVGCFCDNTLNGGGGVSEHCFFLILTPKLLIVILAMRIFKDPQIPEENQQKAKSDSNSCGQQWLQNAPKISFFRFWNVV